MCVLAPINSLTEHVLDLLQGFEKDDASDTECELPQSENVSLMPDLISLSNIGEPGTW
jgi:hypothetical protein